MINFDNLNAKEFSDIGISFRTKEETDSFARVVCRDLEIRIGERISQGMSQEQLDDFDLCETEEETEKWLIENAPDFRDIVAEARKEVEAELIQFRDEIPGNRNKRIRAK